METKYVIDGNRLAIIPEEPIEDNCEYIITVKNIKSLNGETDVDIEERVTTSLSPLYATIGSVQSLVGELDLDENLIIFNIREASRHVEFLTKQKYQVDGAIKTFEEHRYTRKEIRSMTIPYPASQYVKYKAAYDCLLKVYMSNAGISGASGAIGKVSFEQKLINLKPLLDELKELMLYWEMKLLNGDGARPRSAVKSGASTRSRYSKMSPQKDITPIPSNGGRGVFR